MTSDSRHLFRQRRHAAATDFTPSAHQDPTVIGHELCRFACANLVSARTDFDQHSPLAQAGIDSFALVELLLYSERTFGVTVPESHLTRENLASLSSLARCIAGLAESHANARRAHS